MRSNSSTLIGAIGYTFCVLTSLGTRASASHVGIIPENQGRCPVGSEYIWIQMDDEDKPNHSSKSGWTGDVIQNSGNTATRFGFCRVSGSGFKPHPAISYAVLSLDGTTCPAGSFRVGREFDNENTNNQNTKSGNINPNSQKGSNTILVFCHFPKKGAVNPSVTKEHYFPSFGVPYGVFAPNDTNWLLATGIVNTDDEDQSNNNLYLYPDPKGGFKDKETKNIGDVPVAGFGDWIGGGKNTQIEIGKVRDCILDCIHGGTAAGPNCYIHTDCKNPEVIPGFNYWVDANPQWPGVYYKQVDAKCPYGGKPAGPNCQLRAFPSNFVKPGVTYWVDTDPRWPGVYYQQVQGKCPHGGTPAGPNCHITSFSLPACYFSKAVSYWVDPNPQWPGIYYKQVQGQCLYGGKPAGPNCQVRSFPPNTVKSGVKYWIDADPRWPGVYYAKACL